MALGWGSTAQFEGLTRLSYSLHLKLRSELKVDVGYRDLTTLAVDSTHKRDTAGWIVNRTGAEELGTPRDTSQVHPRLLTQALLSGAQAKGAQFVTGHVTGMELDEEGGVTAVRLGDGRTVAADRVLIALGPWTGEAAKWLPRATLLHKCFHTERAHSVVLPTTKPVPPEAAFVNHRGNDIEARQ